MKKANFQVAFLPWCGLEESVEIGPIVFWPYYSEKEARIKDDKIMRHLDDLMQCYVDYKGNRVDTITICSHTSVDFRPLQQQELQDLRNAVDALVFVSIVPQVKIAVCNNNKNLGPPSADIFELVIQNFVPGCPYIAIRAGSLLEGGLRIEEVTFPEPWARGSSNIGKDVKLLVALSACFNKEFRDRIFRSLEWFRMAHIEGGGYSDLTKVVMMAIAFEILLKFPRNDKKEYFRKYMEKNVKHRKMRSSPRSNSKGKQYTGCLAGWWALDFYELRNRIVHGDKVKKKDLIYQGWITHLIVADLLFRECLIHELFNVGIFKEEIKKWADEWIKAVKGNRISNNSTGRNELEKMILRSKFDLEVVHRALGWLTQ